MSIKPKLAQPDQIDIQIGIAIGLELSQKEIAEDLNRSEQALYLRRTGAKKAFIDQIVLWTQGFAAKRLTQKLAAADTKRRLNEKAYKNLEMLLERTETVGEGVEKPVVDALLLAAVKEVLDRTEGKAMDRKAILSAHQETIDVIIRHEVDGEAIDDIAEEASRINELRRKALPPAQEIMEAQLVDSSKSVN